MPAARDFLKRPRTASERLDQCHGHIVGHPRSVARKKLQVVGYPIVGDFDPRLEPFDVIGDGWVTPRDALLVIDLLNVQGTSDVRDLATDSALLDVSGDGWVSAMDALLLVNRLNEEARPRGTDA